MHTDTLPSRYLPEKTAADYLGLSHRTLQKMRVTGAGPFFHKFGRRVLYEASDLDGWASARRRESTSSKAEGT